MIAPSSSRYSSNDMVHNHYLEEAKKKTQESVTSDHNSSELRIHERSKLVPKVVPPADKTATSRQELELLFHHHIQC
ncbi:hypothetical protein Tco_0615111 [Tanacetum coccineum]